MACDNFESDGDRVFFCRHCGSAKDYHIIVERRLRIPLTDLPKNDAKVIEEKNYKMTAEQKKEFVDAQMKEFWLFAERCRFGNCQDGVPETVHDYTEMFMSRLADIIETL